MLIEANLNLQQVWIIIFRGMFGILTSLAAVGVLMKSIKTHLGRPGSVRIY